MKRCQICAEEKPFSEFYAAAGTRDGYRLECKACNLAARALKYRENPRPAIDRATQWQREHPERTRATMDRFRAAGKKKVSDRKSHLKRNYGLTLEAFDALLAAQGGGCAICGRTDAHNVDHDHATGQVRGILCFKCNVALGQLDDDEDRARAAANYLARDDELDDVVRGRVVALAR